MKQLQRPVALFLLLLAASCREPVVTGSGREATEQRTPAGYFNKIRIGAPVDATIQVTPGAAPSFSLTGYANVLPYIRQRVEDHTLYIYEREDAHLYLKENLKAVINVPSLAALDISGASDSKITGDVTGEQLSLSLDGAGSLLMEGLHVRSLNADMSGAIDLSIGYGSAGRAAYDISGSGDVYAFGLQTDTSEISISGAGSAEVNAVRQLSVDVSGAGDVRYKGHPAVSRDISGAGSVEEAN